VPTNPESRRERLKGYVIGLGAVLLSAWPVFGADDSFPLSTYPMFAERRGQPSLDIVVGVDARGHTSPIPPKLVANGETLQAAAAIQRAVHSRRSARQKFCRRIAERVAREPEWSEIESIELRTVRFDPVRYFTASTEPVETRTRGHCRVPR
jgi:hypothetical protein